MCIRDRITRIYGYDNFKITSTKSALAPVLRTVNSNDDRFAKDLLVQRYGLHEVHSYIWCDAKKYKELNIEIEDNAVSYTHLDVYKRQILARFADA